jgi:hypothetical protein
MTDEQIKAALTAWFACEMPDGSKVDQNNFVERMRRALLAASAPNPSDKQEAVGDWLWRELMDYCKERGVAPANNNRLFDLVKRASAQFNAAPLAQSAEQDRIDAERMKKIILGHINEWAIENKVFLIGESWEKLWSAISAAIAKGASK